MPSFITYPSARLKMQAKSSNYTTTKMELDVFDGKKFTLSIMPKIGESLIFSSGYELVIKSITWPIGNPRDQKLPIVIVE